MQQKWAYFAMGLMSGIIVLLAFAVLDRHNANLAYARSYSPQDDDGPGALRIISGGSQQNLQDIVWIVHKHRTLPNLARALKASETGGPDDKSLVDHDNRLSLLLYKVERNGQAMKLVAARDITYDEQMIDYNTEKPKVREILDELKKQVK